MQTRTSYEVRENEKMSNPQVLEPAQVKALERLYAVLEDGTRTTCDGCAFRSVSILDRMSQLARLQTAHATYTLKNDPRVQRLGEGVFVMKRLRN